MLMAKDAETMVPEYPLPLQQFEPISLNRMEEVALLKRNDTKYLFGVQRLPSVLMSVRDQYHILDIDGIRLQHYQTLYFDTAELDLYMQHHNGRRNRYKVRYRRYADSGDTFLEVKHKTKRGRTIKRRWETRGLATHLTPETHHFMQMHYPHDRSCLQPILWNDFYRITLVSKARRERVTIDVNMRLWSRNRSVSFPGIAIAEVKQDGVDRNAPFVRQMRAIDSRPTGFSKYCIGLAILYPNLKHNRFNPQLRLLTAVMGDNYHVRRVH